MSGTPYVDFYRNLGISPVAQDIADLDRHFRRRDSLYRFLGIPSLLVRDKAVIEFGPGSGHNALFTAALGPARYLLVDGNPIGVGETRANLARYRLAGHGVEVVESLFETFDSNERFDLVLAEGFLPHTATPTLLLRRLARFVRPGGILVITTVSPASVLFETIRRLMRSRTIAAGAPADAQLAVLRPLLGPHLATLAGMSRSVDDWLLDNVIQPMTHAALLTIPEAVATLADDFDVYGASPSFFTDFRWYKTVCDVERGFNQNVTEDYYRRLATFIDHRHEPPPHDGGYGRSLEEACRDLWNLMNSCDSRGERLNDPAGVSRMLDRIARMLQPLLPETATALDEAAALFAGRIEAEQMKRFPAAWGRGQQYLSFIRRSLCSSP
jgi:SAM-dependent methyltransferase